MIATAVLYIFLYLVKEVEIGTGCFRIPLKNLGLSHGDFWAENISTVIFSLRSLISIHNIFQDWVYVFLFIIYWVRITELFDEKSRIQIEDDLKIAEERINLLKKIIANCPTPLIVINASSMRIGSKSHLKNPSKIEGKSVFTSNSGRTLIENFNLFK